MVEKPVVQYVPVVQPQPVPNVQPYINLDPPPVINTFSANMSTVKSGQQVTLTWAVSDVLERDFEVVITPGIGTVSDSGSFTVNPAETTTYTLTATNVDGDVSASITITVDPVVAAATYTTGSESSGTGFLSGIFGSGQPDGSLMPFIMLLALLAVAAVVVVMLVTRKPRAAYATAGTSYAPISETGTSTGTRTDTMHTSAASGSRFTSADGESLPVSGKARLLGRNDFLSMVTPSKLGRISRQHLRIECKGDECYIEDNDSTNGTMVNGQTITGKGRQLLKNYDMVDLGGVLTLTFRT